MEINLVCDFCGKHFVKEKNYLKHNCEKMKRHELFNTVDGQIAFMAFNNWRKLKNYPPVEVTNFVNSRYFNAFQKFAKYTKTQSIPDRLGYIKVMVDKDLSPFYWCDYDVYDMYIKTFDEAYTIDKKLEISVDTLAEIAEAKNCQIENIFSNINPIELLRLVTSRRLSPWLLLPSQKFKDFLIFNTTTEEKMLFNTFIDPKKWKDDFNLNKDVVNTIKEINLKLGL